MKQRGAWRAAALWVAGVAACGDAPPPSPSVAPSVASASPSLPEGDPAAVPPGSGEAAFRPSASGRPTEAVLLFDPDEPALVEARARARREIDAVVAKHEQKPLEDLKVKLSYGEAGRTESLWLRDVRWDGEKRAFVGKLDNTPEWSNSLVEGQEMRVPKHQITDYAYLENGKIVGNYTLRALLDRLPPEEAASWRAELAW